MPERPDPVAAWEARLDNFRDDETKSNENAELLSAVDPRWYGAPEVLNGIYRFWIFPPGDSANQGSCLRVERTKSGFSMEITYNPGMTLPRRVARRRATLDNAPSVLASMLEKLFEGRDIPPSVGHEAAWERMLEGFRAYGRAQGAKVRLLSPLASRWAGTCEIYDNSRQLAIIRAGDMADDGKAVWITPKKDGWVLSLASQDRRDGSHVIRQVEAGQQEVAQRLEELLAEMTSDLVAADITAQEAYRTVLRAFVGPALRRHGYKGSSGRYHRAVGDYQVMIEFSKHPFSTKERIEYWLRLSVRHPETAKAYNRANAEAWAQGREDEKAPAGAWFSSFPGNVGPRGHFSIGLRPADDLASHANQLLSDLARYVFPEIERQLKLPLSTPTLPSERPLSPSREQLNREALHSTVEALRRAGVRIDVPEDFEA